MGFFQRLFDQRRGESTPASTSKSADHAVLVHIPISSTMPTQDEMHRWHAVQEELESAIADANCGELDGDEWGGGECTIYCYGPDADRLWAIMKPVLDRTAPPKGTYAIKRYGDADCTHTERVEIA